MKININLNGQPKSWEVAPDEMLLDVLRRKGILSVKHGCDTGSCGACTVLLDEKPILSCSYLAAKADGHIIKTVEGMTSEVEDFGQFLINEGAEQCGFCGPGLALTVISLKKEIENPTDDEINHYLSGNLCRCSGYVGQFRAIKKYLEAENARS